MQQMQKRLELCYRVETEDGLSMYNVGCPFYDERRHPRPSEDQGMRQEWADISSKYPYHESPYYFGFSTMEQLRRWVHCDHKELSDKGLMISVYQTDDYCIGDTQMVFRKDTATLIGRARLI